LNDPAEGMKALRNSTTRSLRVPGAPVNRPAESLAPQRGGDATLVTVFFYCLADLLLRRESPI